MLREEDKQLIKKYNHPGPRYTSYPTALQFREILDPAPLFASSANEKGPLSLYFHLPFCESLCWFCACTTVITKSTNKAESYIDLLIKEMDLTLELLQGDRPVNQLHFGGGSPSFLKPSQLERLCNAIRQRFRFTEDAEISVELDPRTLTEEKVQVLAEQGFNRASFGVQDINPSVQKAVHRIQPDDLNRKCLQWLRKYGIDSINTDLIYGLPLQTPDSFAETLESVLEYDPNRLAIFSYAHVPWVAPAQKILEKSDIPGAETKFEMLVQTIEKLTSSGYTYIGMDHFAKDKDELTLAMKTRNLHRNFQGYSTKSGSELLAFGMSSISQNERSYRQNSKDLNEWSEHLNRGNLPCAKGYFMTNEDILRKDIIMGIMCSGYLDFNYFNRSYSIDFQKDFSEELFQLSDLEKDGLVKLGDNFVEVTKQGRLLLRNIAMPFDAYFKPGESRHAKTV